MKHSAAETMQSAVVFVSRNVVEYKQIPIRPLEHDEVRIAVERFGICGAEPRAIRGGKKGVNATSVRSGIVLGHEGVGRIVAVAPEVNGFSLGDRVAILSHVPCWQCVECHVGRTNHCRNLEHVGLTRDGGAAQFVNLPASAPTIFRIPETVDSRAASLIEPFSCVLHGLSQLNSAVERAVSGQTILLLGAGPIGMLWALSACIFGAQKIIIVDQQKDLSLLKRIIPQRYHDRLQVLSSCAGMADVSVDVAVLSNSDPESFAALKDVLKPLSRLVCFSGLNGYAPHKLEDGSYGFGLPDAGRTACSPEVIADVHYREIHQEVYITSDKKILLIGSTGYTTSDIEAAVAYMHSGYPFASVLPGIITDELSLPDSALAYAHFGFEAPLSKGLYVAAQTVKVSIGIHAPEKT